MFVRRESLLLLLSLCLVSGLVIPPRGPFASTGEGSRVLSLTTKIVLTSSADNNNDNNEGETGRFVRRPEPTLSARNARITGPFTVLMAPIFGMVEEAYGLTPFDSPVPSPAPVPRSPVPVARSPVQAPAPVPLVKNPISTSNVPSSFNTMPGMQSYTDTLNVKKPEISDYLKLGGVKLPPTGSSSTTKSITSTNSSLQGSTSSKQAPLSQFDFSKYRMTPNDLVPGGLGIGTLAAYTVASSRKKEIETILRRENDYLDQANRYAEAKMAVNKAAYEAKRSEAKRKIVVSRTPASSPAPVPPTISYPPAQPAMGEPVLSPSMPSDSTRYDIDASTSKSTSSTAPESVPVTDSVESVANPSGDNYLGESPAVASAEAHDAQAPINSVSHLPPNVPAADSRPGSSYVGALSSPAVASTEEHDAKAPINGASHLSSGVPAAASRPGSSYLGALSSPAVASTEANGASHLPPSVPT
eukprot:CAMPEP_0197824286 /NCGR_PEP_ID=MMETSP1437-20131217/1541_1 /TAXON_ID=49252 ORGANISM="Eucampia antarctica, Strain CCMP1452" /NCGR_SAMPLE_ID=MMETSP1437 /ASSEMBLY_ACC=CAM_ASM_001096 /LENGTH=471 /DNA_ID=CAMNT_0043423839 /DNA_START=264 /DNA_END=1676 /DNA_ORIENTATION=+